VVNCLNFGNPEHPEVMWQLSESIDGMTEACLGLGLPVIGGNVSLYNESGGHDIDPTPVVGLLGVVESLVARRPVGDGVRATTSCSWELATRTRSTASRSGNALGDPPRSAWWSRTEFRRRDARRGDRLRGRRDRLDLCGRFQ